MPVQCTCIQCGRSVTVTPSDAKRGRKFCGFACMAAARAGVAKPQTRRRVSCACERCGAVFQVQLNVARRGSGRYCSRACSDAALRTGNGYVQTTEGREHRVAWVAAHGPIPSGYHVHHVNGDKRDNRLENLCLISATDHAHLHKNLPNARLSRSPSSS